VTPQATLDATIRRAEREPDLVKRMELIDQIQPLIATQIAEFTGRA
jgi:hypothetical protein